MLAKYRARLLPQLQHLDGLTRTTDQSVTTAEYAVLSLPARTPATNANIVNLLSDNPGLFVQGLGA